jgi:hypothetical protein
VGDGVFGGTGFRLGARVTGVCSTRGVDVGGRQVPSGRSLPADERLPPALQLAAGLPMWSSGWREMHAWLLSLKELTT